MPTFDFTSPDGKQYSVDGPGGATPEQAFAILQQHLGNKSPTFDAEAARRAGYSEAEVRGVRGALAAGYSPAEISAHFSQPKPPAGFVLDAPRKGLFDDIEAAPSKASPKDLFSDIQPVGGKLGTVAGPWDDYKRDPIASDFQQQPDGPWKDFGSWRGDPVTSPQVPEGYLLDKQPPHGILANAADFVKSIPGGLINAASEFARGDQIEAENRARAFTDQPNAGPEVPTGKAAAKLVGLPTPQGPAGEYGASVGDFLGNPASYLALQL